MGARTWVLLLGLCAATPAHALPKWCELVYRAWNAYGYHTHGSDWILGYGTALETSGSVQYRDKFVTAPPADAEQRRYDLLARLGDLPRGAPKAAEPPRIVSTESAARSHGDGGSYSRSKDQFGDIYSYGSGGPGSFPELSRYFNIPQYSPHLPKEAPRYLRDGRVNFPREGLTAEDYRDLEPLPQTDPLKSYLGVTLMRIFTEDADKEVPPYNPNPPPGGTYLGNANYYQRGDGTYYIYDFPGGTANFYSFDGNRVRQPTDVMQKGMRNLSAALDTVKDPAEKTKAIEFYLDSLMIFPEVGKERLRKANEATKTLAEAYAKDLKNFEGDKRNLLFRLLTGFSDVRGPHFDDKIPDSVHELESYFAFPLYMLAFHKQMGHARTQPELMRALEERVARYRQEIAGLEAMIPEAPPALKREITFIQTETAKH